MTVNHVVVGSNPTKGASLSSGNEIIHRVVVRTSDSEGRSHPEGQVYIRLESGD